MPLVESFSGIRGIYDDGLDEKVAMKYCNSYLNFLKNKYGNILEKRSFSGRRKSKAFSSELKIIIGTDTRPSKDILKNAIIEVLDCNIIDLGIASTPMVEFAVRHFKADGGIIVTASHNEPYWNGFKFLDKNSAVLKAKEMDSIIKYYHKKKNDKIIIKIKKIEKKYDEINKKYSDFILSFLSKEDKEKIKKAKFKIILDPNGGTGIIAKQILEKLNVKVKGINMKYGIFNRAVEPNEDSLFYLANMVREKNYDFAAGFDCDADRIEIMTRKGLVSGNELLAIIADEILDKAKNKTIVVNNATSSMIKEIAKKYNANYFETEVGEINVVDKMYKLKAPIGGEGSSSGVIIPPSRCRDGVLTLIYLLKTLAIKEVKLEDFIRNLPKYHYIKRKIKINPKKYPLIKNKLKKYYGKKGKIDKTEKDSLKVYLDNRSFVWFRVSKTEANLLRVIADAPKKEQTEKIIKEALNLVKNG